MRTDDDDDNDREAIGLRGKLRLYETEEHRHDRITHVADLGNLNESA